MNYPQIKPTLNLDFSNTKTLDPRITFRRGTPGAYYDGKTYAKAEENLIDYSEDFSQWGAGTDISIINNNNIAPDGSLTASLIDDGTNAGYKQFYKNINIQDGVYFASIYVKNPESAGRRFLILSCYFTLDSYAAITFDTLTETIQKAELGNFKVISSFASDVGNGWYRIGLNFLLNSHPSLNFNVNMSNSVDATWGRTYTGSNQQLYIWGAQLEQRDSLTAYTPTNGNPITKYQPQLMFASPDQPRFDHDVLTGESKGLLIEESRTNLVQDSEFIEDISSNGTWWNQTATVSSVEKNQTISPSGEVDATKIIYNTNQTSGGLVMKYHTDTSVGDIFTGSVYLKAGTLDKVYFYFNSRNSSGVSVASPAIIANLSSGVIESTQDSGGMTISDYSIDDVGNGWYRIVMTSTVITGVDVISLGIYMSGGPTNSNAVYDHFFVWGAQMEKASFATSYIKTSGASATRSADNASITGENFSSWYRQDEGSLYCEAAKRDVSYSVIPVSVDGGSSDYIFLNLRSTESFEIKKNNSYQVSSLGFSNVDAETYHKIIGAYKKDNSAVSLNGIDALTDTDCEIPAINRLVIGSISGAAQNCHIKKISYYPQRLTNEQLQQLTK